MVFIRDKLLLSLLIFDVVSSQEEICEYIIKWKHSKDWEDTQTLGWESLRKEKEEMYIIIIIEYLNDVFYNFYTTLIPLIIILFSVLQKHFFYNDFFLFLFSFSNKNNHNVFKKLFWAEKKATYVKLKEIEMKDSGR